MTATVSSISDFSEPGRRKCVRSNVLMSGRLASATTVLPVQVRDISNGGALLSGHINASVGSAFVLQVKNFSLPCRLVWRSAARAGVEFDEPFSEHEKLTGRISGQDDVDSKVAQIKSGVAPVVASISDAPEACNLSPRIAEEMRGLQRRLEGLGESLAGDPILLFRYQRQLQDIDVMMQILGHLATVTESDDQIAAAKAIGRESLQRRLLR